MTFEVKSEVIIPAVGKLIHEHRQDFPKNSNVFGRVLEYRKYMENVFPGCKYTVISARRVQK